MKLVAATLVACIAASCVGVGYVLRADWRAFALIGVVALALVARICYALGEWGWTFAILWAVVAVLGNGLYALHLLGVPDEVIAGIAAGLAALIVIVLGYALIRSGAADLDDDSSG